MELAGLTWERPWAWWALLVPIALLLLAKRPLRPRTVATGALGLWRRVQESPRGGGGERPQIPPGLWWLCAGLVAGALAMAGPKERTPGSVRTWTVIVDRSPSMHLPVAPGGEARLAHALALLEDEWLGHVKSGDEVRWFDGSDWAGGLDLPEAWADAPRAPMARPMWRLWDAPGVVWLCDRAPELERLAASVCASGGAAAPGPVAVDGEDRLDWSEDGLLRVVGGAPPRSVRVVELGGELETFIEIWADERGLSLNRGGHSPEDVLVVTRGSDAAQSMAGLLSLRPGEGELEGSDPAAFALFWSERLDGHCLPAAGLSPVTARAQIGKGMWIYGRAPDERSDGGHSGRAWEGWLALLSCGLVAVALVGYLR